MINVECDLYANWLEVIKDELTGFITIDVEQLADDELAHAYLNCTLRYPETRPRKIHYTHDFRMDQQYANGWADLKQKIENGTSLYPHISLKILEGKYNDKLLNDWNILHFHLSDQPHPKNTDFNSRTGPLLFAIVKADDLYAINVFNHGKWSDLSILEKVNSNWPHLLEPFKLKNGTLANTFTSEQHGMLRGVAVNTPVTLSDGNTFFPPGGGFTSSGINPGVVQYADRVKAELINTTKEIKSNPSKWINHPKAMKHKNNTLKAILAVDGERFVVLFPDLSAAVPLSIKYRALIK